MLAGREKIRFAVVGCGHIGKRHATIIQKNEDCALVAIIDIKDRSVVGAEAFDVPFFHSLEDFFSSGLAADVITIATPNGLHVAQGLACLKHGCHIVVEKPLALNKSEALQLVNEAGRRGLHVFTVMQNRYSPPAQWLKNIVDQGVLGQLYMLQMNCFWNRDERYYEPGGWHGTKELDGGCLFTQFSHFIDMMYWIYGDIENIRSEFANFNHQRLTEFEDSGLVNFNFVNGGMGSICFSTSVWDRNMESSMTIIAEKGCVKIGGQYMDRVSYCHVRDYELPALPPTNPGNDYGTYRGSAQNHHFVIENVVEVLRGTGIKDDNCEAFKVVDIIERIYQS